MNKNLIKIIKNLISTNMESLKANLLGPNFVNKSFIFTLKNFDPKTTIGHAYLNANSMHSSSPDSMDKKTLSIIENNALNHIESLEQKSYSEISRIFTNYFQNIEVKSKLLGKSPEDLSYTDEGMKLYKEFRDNINSYVDKINTSASTIVENELNTAANFGAFDGILHAAKNMGIEDPVVCKLGVNDEKKCKHCWKLWMREDKITPKVYKLSELAGSPGDWKSPVASVSTTHPNCFTEGRVPVLTDAGWKTLKTIIVGDKVLTHTGKFKKVLSVINEPYVYKKNIIIKYNYNGKILKHHVTPDHKFLTQRGWVEAKDLNLEDKFIQLQYPCTICKKEINTREGRGFFIPKTCSQECFNKLMSDNTKKYHDSLTEEDRDLRSANCSSGTKKAYESGSIVSPFSKNYWTEEKRKEQKEKLISRLSLMMRKSASTRVSKKQKYAFNWVKDFYNNRVVELEYNVGPYFLDIAIVDDKIAIEIDGKYHNGDRLLKDENRDKWLKSQGWTVLRYGFNREKDINKSLIISDIQNILNNHDNLYSFKETNILSITHGRTGTNGRVFCLTVEEDESFIAKGIVSHNCRDVLTLLSPGFGFEGGKIVYKGRDEKGELWDEYARQKS